MEPSLATSHYRRFLLEVREKIQSTRIAASSAINRHLLELYWQIGKSITERQESHGWGDAVIDKLSADLRRTFPNMTGFSRTNLFRMRQFFLSYRQVGNCPTAVGQIPWSHNIILLERIRDPHERLWYANQVLALGWSKRVLVHQLESGLYHRQASSKDHNFDRTLPAPQSDLAAEMMKDPYHFDFLQSELLTRERDLERALVDHLQDFLLELGVGFAFVGRQHRLEVDGAEYRVDLLFYHLKLRSLVAVDLKMDAFRPEYVGKMNFYLSVLDDGFRHPSDSPSIGILLCKEKHRTTVEYALRDTTKPIGVASYRITSTLPRELRGILPTSAEFEKHLRCP